MICAGPTRLLNRFRASLLREELWLSQPELSKTQFRNNPLYTLRFTYGNLWIAKLMKLSPIQNETRPFQHLMRRSYYYLCSFNCQWLNLDSQKQLNIKILLFLISNICILQNCITISCLHNESSSSQLYFIIPHDNFWIICEKRYNRICVPLYSVPYYHTKITISI